MAQEEGSLTPEGGADSARPDGDRVPPSADMTMREQVKDIIDSILADSEPRSEGARSRLRALMETHSDDPAGALLEHLLETRKEPSSAAPVPVHLDSSSVHLESVDAARTVSIPVSHEVREGIQAILADKLLLTAFQPVHALPSGEVVGVEALTRFVGEDGAGADVWFNEAAAAGLGTELEIAALHCALTAAHDVPGTMSVALNLTPSTSRDPRVRNLLAAASLAPERIIVELTGSLADVGGQTGSDGLGPLRALGLRLAINASGAALVSLELVEQLRPDIIKLDRHLIEGIESSEGQRIRARAIVELAREIGAEVIAVGIETAGELEQVSTLNITAAQGYLLGRPSVHPLDWSAWSIRAQTESQPAG
ncbi:EAL domain-containing protein (putative c-di-GMP-specific phosphodiesterase class I) [Paenarthrobacter nitroguajacolicus]|uniref:EAL domain-containing protein n=1 Tax=Paenarthrobacter nitroguajacolicus TaxID=211146 RepID=UPI002863CC9E|nr:EAL domain-containing protein [Paenarthrobacter nitroguajacolicus]MDR6986813.1 EAL domain-containing protein (putative c-di-GMP-specific phosphodiesterase class I) [Paenarthrobacter nitroguajacolicus]